MLFLLCSKCHRLLDSSVIECGCGSTDLTKVVLDPTVAEVSVKPIGRGRKFKNVHGYHLKDRKEYE